jgi:Winged helix-turn-helix DNA-binding
VSVLDQFRLAEEALTERLRELRPLAEEYRELEQIAERRGLSVGDQERDGANEKPGSPPRQGRRSRPAAQGAHGSRQAAAQAKRPARATRRRQSRPAAAKAKPATRQRPNRREDIIRLVQQRPGISIKQIGDELGIDPTGLYRPVRELQQQGAITKQGPRLNPSA